MTRTLRDRLILAGGGISLGGLVAGAALANGDGGTAILGLVLVSGLCLFAAFSRSEWAAIGTELGDERQRSINLQATQIAYFAVASVSAVGFLTELARGEAGPFTLVGAVGGFTHMGAIAFLRLRR